jgi:1-acyl-sn-glycerol-3-phosphate acyltransferase
MRSVRRTPYAEMTGAYRLVVLLTSTFMRHWCRLDVTGVEHMPTGGPTLLISNHDSYWDPIAIATACRHRRQVRALSKSSLWKSKPVALMMNGMGHIPIERGVGDTAAMDTAITELAAGACVGIFPEGTRSLGRVLRARSGAGRLVEGVPGMTIVCCRVSGTTDVVRLPRRPSITVDFFPPAGGSLQPGETLAEFGQRLLDEIRAGSPPAVAGRSRTAAKFRAAATARD